MSGEVEHTKIRWLHRLADMLEADPKIHADFAEIGKDAAWCIDQAARVRSLADTIEANWRPQ